MEGLGPVITWDGRQLPLVDLPYNATIRNERAVELAVVFDWLRGCTGDGLEVGNVLAHYGRTGHRVADLFEQAPGVENVDVFDVDGRYDWIVSISTVEHVRWDVDRDPTGAPFAIRYLRDLLRPGGELLVTVPFGWNPPLDARLPCGADTWGCWQRDGAGWAPSDLTPVEYGPQWANKVWVGLWRS
jgi:SAM-dependent methyltransferase